MGNADTTILRHDSAKKGQRFNILDWDFYREIPSTRHVFYENFSKIQCSEPKMKIRVGGGGLKQNEKHQVKGVLMNKVYFCWIFEIYL